MEWTFWWMIFGPTQKLPRYLPCCQPRFLEPERPGCIVRITIDALPLIGAGGITTYVRGLVQALLAFDTANDYELLFRTFPRARRREVARLQHDPDLNQAQFRCLQIPDGILERIWRLETKTGWTFLSGPRTDVFLATLLIAPRLDPGRVVPIVYDLIPLRFPQWYRNDATSLECRLRTVARQTQLWLVISEATRKDLKEFLGIQSESIRVVHPGVDVTFRRAISSVARQEVLERYGIRRPYILYVGGYGPHKNVETLLQAFQLVREKCSRRCQLVLVGSRRWASQELRSALAFDEDAAVSFLGYVPREDLALLYGAAELFVSVSLFEGFGLPALEAMACGTPVVASRVGALPEVVGDAGSLVDPRDVDGIAAAIINLLEDQEVRDQLAERARQYSSQFSWERAARMAQAVFAELARG